MNKWIRSFILLLFALSTQWVQAQGVARIEGKGSYTTLESAVAASHEGDVISLLLNQGYSLPGIPNNITITAAEGVTGAYIEHSSGNICSIPNGCTFKNLEFRFGNNNYHGFQHAGPITMENCKISGKLFSYGDMTFTGCNFVQDNSDYHMWCYSGNVTYNNCTFTNNITKVGSKRTDL